MKGTGFIWQVIKQTAIKNFKSATVTFTLIMLVVCGFQLLFGPENMVLGIIFAPTMLALMARDMTAHPIKHFFRQALIFCILAVAACVSFLLPAYAALTVHFIVAFFLLYTYTCDCGDHMYFQYILSYLFLIFIGPVTLRQLPLRLLGMVTGAACLILYQYVKGRGRIAAVTRDTLLSLLKDTKSQISYLLSGEPACKNARLLSKLKAFSQLVEYRRKTTLGLSDASIAAVETVLSLERLNSAISSPDFVPTEQRLMLLQKTVRWIDCFCEFIQRDRNDIPQIQRSEFCSEAPDDERFYRWLVNLRESFLTMLFPEKRRSFCKTNVSLWPRLKLAVNFSPMRAAYALRLSCLLAAGILLVRHFNLEHGKWLLFTIASVSLPYSDEVGSKAKQRFFATLIGGAAGFIAFSLIPSSTGKMIAMLASGYLSCYMSNYLSNFSCATFGALGGAVFTLSAAGFTPVGSMVLIRVIYIAAGIIIAMAFNCLVFPVNKKRATRNLAKKYIKVTNAVSESYKNRQPDVQLHYHLLLRMYRLEDKLRQNAIALEWDGVHAFLQSRQRAVWQAEELSA